MVTAPVGAAVAQAVEHLRADARGLGAAIGAGADVGDGGDPAHGRSSWSVG